MEHFGKLPDHLLQVYQYDKNNWYKSKNEGILPKYLQKQPARDKRKIQADQVLSNFKTYLTGIRKTKILNLYTGDSGRLLKTKGLVVFVFSDCQKVLLAFIFRGYNKYGPVQTSNFAERFYKVNSQKIRECINANTPPLGS